MRRPEKPGDGLIEDAARTLADQGHLIEIGWVTFQAMYLKGAPASVLRLARLAYMSGALHLYGSILAMLEPGATSTSNDLRRMQSIAVELSDFLNEMKLHTAKPEGNG